MMPIPHFNRETKYPSNYFSQLIDSNNANGLDIGQTIDQVSSGNITGAITGVVNEVIDAIKGRPYTSGQAKLVEKYYQYQLGQPIGDWRKVNQSDIQPVINFYTQKFGIPITTVEDLDNIDPNYTIGNNIAVYKSRDPEYAKIPDESVRKAIEIKRYLPYSAPNWDFNNAYQRAGVQTLNSLNNSNPSIMDNLFSSSAKPTFDTKFIMYIVGGIIALIVIILIVKSRKK